MSDDAHNPFLTNGNTTPSGQRQLGESERWNGGQNSPQKSYESLDAFNQRTEK